MGGVAQTGAGNVVNSQPHVPRLIRAATPPSNIEAQELPGKDSKGWLGEVQEG